MPCMRLSVLHLPDEPERCIATITTGVADIVGTPLAANYPWTFTTGATPDTTPPTVSS